MAEMLRKVTAVACVPRGKEEAERTPKSLGRGEHAAAQLLQHR